MDTNIINILKSFGIKASQVEPEVFSVQSLEKFDVDEVGSVIGDCLILTDSDYDRVSISGKNTELYRIYYVILGEKGPVWQKYINHTKSVNGNVFIHTYTSESGRDFSLPIYSAEELGR